MSQDRFQLVMDLFQEALALPPGDQTAFLVRRCNGDESLRTEVEALLAHDAKPASSLKSAGGGVRLLADRIAPRVTHGDGGFRGLPVLSGQYRVIRVIGEGGMGTVYEAEQARPRRTVALKSIRPGLVTRQMLARLEREAEVLGRLHHPGIAQVYEAGAADPTREDQAFFAMEFVRGQSLTAHCDSRKLALRQRLELVAKVCDAVQHAHERRVVHRDLKPGNILVDENGQPKVLDFGVARALDGESGATVHTMAGQLVGTLPYMSPEQVGSDPGAVDERSDVYAIGVILYQLATGKLPHDHTGLSIPESARVIRDVTPARPSSLNAKLKGDVETIICKALDKEPGRRYQSAAALGEDIRRWLTGHPIAAKEDSAFYVLTKQMKRHRAAMAVVVGAFLAISAFALYWAAQSRRNAQLAERERIARAEAESARLASDRRLRASNVERGRLLGLTGNFAGAESLIWAAHRDDPTPQSRWALWELYSKHPCVLSVPAHQGPVRAVAMSRSGDELASSAADGRISIWSAKTGELRRTLEVGAPSLVLVYSPGTENGLISLDADGRLREWDTASGKELHSLAVPGGRLLSITILGETGKVAVTSDHGGVRVISLRTWTIERELLKASKVLRTISSDATGSVVATAGEDGRVFIWAIESGTLLGEFQAHAGPISAIALSSDAKTLATGGLDKVLRLWRLSADFSPSEPRELNWTNGWVRALAFTRDGRHLLASGFWRVDVWDVERQALAVDVTQVEQPPYVAALSPNESMIVSGAENGTIRVWEKQALGALRRTLGSPGGVAAIAISSDGRLVAGSGTSDGVVRVYEVGSEALVPLGVRIGHQGRVSGLAFTPDGSRICSAGYDGTIREWSSQEASGSRLLSNPDDNLVSLDLSPDGARLAYSTREGGIFVVDRGTAKAKVIAPPSSAASEVLRVVFNPAGTSLAATRRVKWLEFYDPTTGALQWKAEADAPVWSLAFLTGTDLLAIGTWDSGIEIWNTKNRFRIAKLTGHTQLVNGLAWMPADAGGQSLLASASSDGTIKLWSVEDGLCLATLRPDVGAITGVAFVPGRRVLLSSHADGTVGQWDLAYYDRHIEAAGLRFVGRPSSVE